jgi:hypothetical protein
MATAATIRSCLPRIAVTSSFFLPPMEGPVMTLAVYRDDLRFYSDRVRGGQHRDSMRQHAPDTTRCCLGAVLPSELRKRSSKTVLS